MSSHRVKRRQDERGTSPLVPGSAKVKPGTGKLKPGTKALKPGTGKLKAGTARLAPSGYSTGRLRMPPSKRRKRRTPPLVKLLAGFALVGMLAGCAAIAGSYSFLEKLNPLADRHFTPTEVATILNPLLERRTFLLMGTDWSYDAQGKRIDDGPVRSDAMMVVSVDAAAHRLNILSVPRDTRVLLKGRHDKINAALAYGGTKLACEAVSELVGVPVTDWATVNTHSLERLVDVMGGVKLYVQKDMFYVDETAHLGINIHKGWHTMNGLQAHQYVRFRHDELGDIGRIQRQQQFLRAVAEQMLVPKTLGKIPQLLACIQENVQTSLSGTDLMRMALWAAPRLSRHDVKMVMLPGAFSGKEFEASYWLANEPAAKALGQRLLVGGPQDNYTLADQPHLKVTVLNGTNHPALGTLAAKRLRAAGWVVWSVGDASTHDARHTSVIAQTGHDELDGELGRALQLKPNPVSASVGDLGTDYTIVIGEDFARAHSFGDGEGQGL